ncbi:MAG: PA14 domain-containing protein [Candidatus Promineifilaceae bacterium]|nr:PA14 domain-containing protein [Candidatus Promineifilaceae bacterium]
MGNIRWRNFYLLAAPILAVFALVILWTSTSAQDAQWYAQFWNNRDLRGDPVHTRFDNTIDFDWGGGSPHPLVNDGDFSARWTRRVNFQPGTYRFTATMDDGMRAWIDGNLIIDSWTDSQEHTMTRDVFVTGGNHDMRVEYYEARGQAVARFSWQLIHPEGESGGSGGGAFYPNWRGEYFNNTTLSGTPALVRDDRYFDHNWGTGSPAPGIINNDFFSARWTKTIDGRPGQYRIILTSDDGSRLFINNVLMIDNWNIQAPTSRAVDYFYPGGPIEVRVEYFEQTGNALISTHLAIIPPSG